MRPTKAIGFLRFTTVDGGNPTPVDNVNVPLFTGFYTSQVVSRISAINSGDERG